MRPASLGGRRRLAAVLLAVAGLLHAARAEADHEHGHDEAAIKAAFAYNFAKFTAWPADRFASAAAPIGFCVHAGALDPHAVESLDGKQVGDRPLAVRVLGPGEPIEPCHLLFVGEPAGGALETLLTAARARRVLLVSDRPDFAARGGHIGLVRDGNRIRFQVNLRAARAAGLTVSSRLLQLAEIVDPGHD